MMLRCSLQVFRGRLLIFISGVFAVALSSSGLVAQESTLDLRDSLSLDEGPSDILDYSEIDDGAPTDRNVAVEGRPRNDRLPLGRTLQQQFVLPGQTVQRSRFAESVQALSQNTSSAGVVSAGNDEGVFDGDTVVDRAEGYQKYGFRFRPSLEVGTGYTDNSSNAQGGKPGAYYALDGAISAASQWERHEVSGELRGSLRGFFQNDDDNLPVLSASGGARLDLAEDTTALLEASYNYSLEERSSAEVQTSSGNTDAVHGMGLRLSLDRSVGLMRLRGELGVERTAYAAQSILPRSNSVFDVKLRASLDSGAMVEPYLEGGVLLRTYDKGCHGAAGCLDRAAKGWELKTGLQIDRGPKLQGAIGVGWRAEHFDDDQLDVLQGLVFDGSFVWSPTRRDTVTTVASTRFASSGLAGASGSISHSGEVRYAHQFSEAFVADAQIGYTRRSYAGIDITEQETTGSVGLAWAFAKDAALLSRYTFTSFNSSVASRSYTSNAIEAGVRLRH